MFRTQVSPHRHGFLVERQYDASDRGTWITTQRYFTQFPNLKRKGSLPWMDELCRILNQPSANLPAIEIPIAPTIAYNIHERLERAEAEIEARKAKEAANQFKRDIIHNCTGPDCVICGNRQESVFEECERIVTQVSDRHP